MKPATVFFIFAAVFAFSCKKNSFITSSDARISLSVDTIHFDTLFTTTGSTTHFFKIFNDNDQKLRVSDITLAGGENSYFKINADGAAGPAVSNLEVDAGDSIYVFVTVQIDQSLADLPFVVQDSVRINYNGNTEWVHLDAFGQNANFLRAHIITSDTTWTNEKPFVILDGILVAPGVELNIEEGTKVYLHADAPFIVDGSLKAIGKKFDSTKIVFTGDRLDEFYRDLPASWPGIYFRESSESNILKHVIVRNAYQGIVVQEPSPALTAKLTLEECIVDNCYDAGIIGVNTSIEAVNTLISNCGKNVQLVQGGAYTFKHCTDVAISNEYLSHRQPVMAIADFIKIGNDVTFGDMTAQFTNCIFWGANGTVDNEVITVREGSGVFDVNFTNCLWKVKDAPKNVNEVGTVVNQDPLFDTVDTRSNIYDFRLKEDSPAVNTGISAGITSDLDGNNRTNIPDIGAYETTF